MADPVSIKGSRPKRLIHSGWIRLQRVSKKWCMWKCAILINSLEKWLHNRIYCPSNRSKQIQETHKAYSDGTQYTRQSLNEKQHTWLYRQRVIVCEAMNVVFHSNFAAYIVCRRYKPCEFPGFVWTDCWGNKSYYVITSPANNCLLFSTAFWMISKITKLALKYRLFHQISFCHSRDVWLNANT